MDDPFIVTLVPPHGTVKLWDPKDGPLFKVNGQRLKPCIQNLELGKDVESVNLTDPIYFFKLVTGTLGLSAHTMCLIPDTGLRSSSLL